MKKALIFGISGQDGGYLAKFLIEKNYTVYGTSRDAQRVPFHNLFYLDIHDQIEVVSVATNDFRSILQALNKVQPDEIYNLAGQSSVGLSFLQPVETFESICIATLNIMEAIRFTSREIKFYNACSSECFGDTGDRIADEITPFYPRSPYAVAKASAFWEVVNYREAYDLFACSGILFNHESPLRPERFVTRKIVAAACRIASGSNEKLFLGDISIQRDWGWAPEYVKAMWLMMQQNKPGEFVIATGETHSLKDFVTQAFFSVGLDWHRHVLIDPDLKRPSELRIGRGNPMKAQKELGWRAQYKMKDVVDMMIRAEQITFRKQ